MSAQITTPESGTKDKNYDLITVTHLCLEHVWRLDQYARDAEREGDGELASLFRRMQEHSRRGGEESQRLLAKRDRRITDDGVLVISAQRFRTQERNREDARERLAAFIAGGLQVAAPRIATRPSRASKERRLSGKRERGTIKRERSRRDWD